MSDAVKTVLCGIGGFGQYYLRSILDHDDMPIEFVGFVDPSPERCSFLERLRADGLPIYPSLAEFYEHGRAELAIIASPIQHHADQAIKALEQGSHVLCEKPLCATADDAHRMLDARRRAGRVAAIGYQHSFTATTQQLKADILAGVWGRPRRLKCLALCPRPRQYYHRNRWAGRVRDDGGRPVFDSPVNNAVAHYLHHMFYLLGDGPTRAAVPVDLEARLFRAHDIENYDTAIVRCRVAGGAEILFASTHTGRGSRSPVFEFEFEQGTLRLDSDEGDMLGRFKTGDTRTYAGALQSDREKIADTVAAIREGREALCGIEAAMSHTLAVAAAQEAGPIEDIPPQLVREVVEDGRQWLEVAGLEEMLTRCYREACLPGASWPTEQGG